MKHQHRSSTIDHSDYDPIKRMLSIKFHSGDTVYQYHDVPMSVANEFQKAKSAGKYFHREIKEKFKTVKL